MMRREGWVGLEGGGGGEWKLGEGVGTGGCPSTVIIRDQAVVPPWFINVVCSNMVFIV